MKFMILVKATQDSEKGVMPAESLFAEMGAYHEELSKAGVLVDASGLRPSSNGWRIRYDGKKRSVVDGPFAETKELVAGYTIIDVKSREEALEWTKRFPNPSIDRGQAEIEVRPFFDLDDFPQSEAIARFRELEKRQPIPSDMHVVTPHLVCAGAAQAIEFYKKAFGATEEARLPGPDGKKLMHAMIRINGAAVMLVDEMPEWGALGPKALKGSSVTIHLYVENADAFFKRAVDAGAKVVMPLADMFWGDRYGKIEDPFGHHWSIATHVRDVSMDEAQEAMKKMGQPS
jgi:uncharacterized glyoxalase superfamily protein PhnB